MLAANLWTELVEAWQGSPDFWDETFIFLFLVLRSVGLALVLGIPLGILLTRWVRLATPVIAVLGLLQTVPSFVLIALLIPLLGIGPLAAVVAAVLYSLFPIVLNTHVGITQVPAPIRDAARGMGMTAGQALWNVELPLAFPVILAGVRTGTIYAVGIITICAMAGARGLGDYIVTGMQVWNDGLIWLGALPILLLTLLLFSGLGSIVWLSRKNSRLGLGVGGGLIVGLALAGIVEPLLRGRRADIVLGSKNFTEGQILTEILRQMLVAHTDLTVEVVPNLGPNLIYKALQNGEIDAYPEYTGNLLTGRDALNRSVPADRATITDLVRRQMQERFHLVLLDPFGLNNTYALCVRRPVAKKYGLKTISDLRAAPNLRVVVDLSFLRRPDGWPGLVAAYDLHFRKQPVQVSPDMLYRVVLSEEPTVICGFATDWQIGSPRFDLVVLQDDRHYFPDYRGAPLVRESVLKQHPEIAAVLDRLNGRIDDQTMRRLNGEVAEKRRTVAAVAQQFLLEQGLLRKP